MHRMCHNDFVDDHEVTVGVEFGSLLIKMKGIAFKLQIWDTAGQERFDSLTKMYFNGAAAAFIVYDITDSMSFEKANKWVEDLDKTDTNNNMPIIKFLVGNKSDMMDSQTVST